MIKLRKVAVQVILVCGALFFLVAVLISVPSLILKAMEMPPPVIFREYVMEPIPGSVTNIKADKPQDIGGYMYTLRFNINRADLKLIIHSRPFQKVWNAKYNNGSLSWGWDRDGPLGISKRVQGMTVYGSGFFQREPRWFRPGLWDNPEVYAFCKVGDLVNVQAFERDRARSQDRVYTKVLLYNEEEGEAYCVVSRFRP